MKRFLLLNSTLFFIAITVYLFFTQTRLFAAPAVPSIADETVDVGQSGKVDPGFGNSGTGKYIIPPIKPSSDFLGQNHFYTVTFRGNGEAIINLKVVLANFEEEPLKSVSLRVPRVDIKNLAVYQVMRESTCIRYIEQPLPLYEEQSGASQKVPETDFSYQKKSIIGRPVPICDEYDEPNYYDYGYGSAKYLKANYALKGDTIEIELPKEIKKDKSGSFFIYFRALGYTTKNIFGTRQFTFETLQVNDIINSLQIGIATDSDLYLRGAQGRVSYRFDEGVAALKSESGLTEMKSPRFDQFFNEIGQGNIVKNANNLQPLDSFTVKGSYADSRLKLYGKEITIGIIIFVLVVTAVIVLIKFYLKRRKKEELSGETLKGSRKLMEGGNLIPFIEMFGLSFISSILILIYAVIISFVLRNFTFNSPYFDSQSFFYVMILFLSLGVCGLLLFGPVVFLGLKRGWKWGLTALIGTIIFLGIYLILIFMITILLQGNPYPSFYKPLSG